jgi:hypothetical protein
VRHQVMNSSGPAQVPRWLELPQFTIPKGAEESSKERGIRLTYSFAVGFKLLLNFIPNKILGV